LALVAHASLYPFGGWRAPAEDALAFVLADWPPYVTAADLILNILAYLPVGLLLTLVLMDRMRGWHAALLGLAGGALLSFLLELLQAFLPARIPSNVDLLTNAAGAALGAALAAAFGNRWLLSGELHRLRGRYFHAGGATDVGFLLLALWLMTQLNTEVWLFGNGDLRHLIPGEAGVGYSAETYRHLEAGVAALNFLGVACLVTAMARTSLAAAVTLAVLTVAALCLKSTASAALFVPGNPKLWLTPGSLLGLGAGVAAWLLLLWLPRRALTWVAAACFVLGTVLVNVAPENPYLAAALKVLQGGHYYSFNAMMRLLSALWPFAVVLYLLFPARIAAGSQPNREARSR
jgi:VanZ family protein